MTTTLTPTAERIVALFETIDLADVNAGIDWYADARATVDAFAARFGITPQQAAGVIAALSPLNDWDKNVKDAETWLATRASVHTRVFLGKCERILAGENILRVLNAPKTQNFYLSIMSSGRRGICIDRHAFDIAVGVRHTDKERAIGIRAYRAAAKAYRDAADILAAHGATVTPAEIQSVTWVAWRKVWKGVRNTASIAA